MNFRKANKIFGFIQGSLDKRRNHKLSKLGYIDKHEKEVHKKLYTDKI